MKIQFGTGNRKLKGFVNTDIDPKYKPDLVWDMNRFPYPFKSNSAEKIICEMTLEHIKAPTRAIDEFHRIIKPNGEIYIRVPHFSHVGAHLADMHICVFNTDYFRERSIDHKSQDELHWNWIGKKFKQVAVKIIFPKGKLTIASIPFQLIFGKNRFMQSIYEHTFLKNLYPASEIEVKFSRKE